MSRYAPSGQLHDLEIAILRILRDAGGDGWLDLDALCARLPDETRTRILMCGTALRDRRDIAWYRPSASEGGHLRLRLTPTGQREIAAIEQLRMTV